MAVNVINAPWQIEVFEITEGVKLKTETVIVFTTVQLKISVAVKEIV